MINKRFMIIAVALLLLIPSAMAGILPPVADPNIELRGDVNFFFWNDSSDIPLPDRANKFATYPQLQDTKLLSATVSSGTGERTLGIFITDPFSEGRVMAPGLTRYRIYANVTSDVGTTTLNFIPHIHYANGTDARLFYGVSRTVDINGVELSERLISYARRNYTVFEPGSSLFIKVNASTTSSALRTINLAVAGTNSASMATIGYWEVAEGVDVDPSTPAPSSPIVMAVTAGFIGGFVAILYWRRRYRR